MEQSQPESSTSEISEELSESEHHLLMSLSELGQGWWKLCKAERGLGRLLSASTKESLALTTLSNGQFLHLERSRQELNNVIERLSQLRQYMEAI